MLYISEMSHIVTFKSHRFWPPKKAGIIQFLEFLKVVAYTYDSTIGPHNIYMWEKYPRGTSSWSSIKNSPDSNLIW